MWHALYVLNTEQSTRHCFDWYMFPCILNTTPALNRSLKTRAAFMPVQLRTSPTARNLLRSVLPFFTSLQPTIPENMRCLSSLNC